MCYGAPSPPPLEPERLRDDEDRLPREEDRLGRERTFFERDDELRDRTFCEDDSVRVRVER